MTRVGVFGAGMMGAIHARAWLPAEGVESVAIFDPRVEAARTVATETGAAVAESAEELLHRADIVSVCTPPGTHPDIVRAAAEAGVHVLLEKPSARSLAEHDEMQETVDLHGVTCMVGTTSRFYPESRDARDHLRSHDGGEILAVHERVHLDHSELPAWYLDPQVAGGGVFLTNGIHAIDRILWLTASERADVERVRFYPHPRTETFAEVGLRLPSGASASLEFLWQAGVAPRSELLIVRERDTIDLRTWDRLRVSGDTGTTRAYYADHDDFIDRTTVGIRAEVAELLGALASNRNPESDLREHRRALEVIERAYALAPSQAPSQTVSR